MCRVWKFVKNNPVIIALLALFVSAASAIFAYLSYEVGKDNLYLQRENAKPSITFDRVTLDLNNTDEWILHLGFRTVNYVESGHIAILATDQDISTTQLLQRVELTNQMPRGTGAESHPPLPKKLLGSYLILCVVLKDLENMPHLSEYYYAMPEQIEILTPRSLSGVRSQVVGKIRASHPCPISSPAR